MCDYNTIIIFLKRKEKYRVKQLKLNRAFKIVDNKGPDYLALNFVRVKELNQHGTKGNEYNIVHKCIIIS